MQSLPQPFWQPSVETALAFIPPRSPDTLSGFGPHWDFLAFWLKQRKRQPFAAFY